MPYRIKNRRTLIDVTDAVAPLIRRDEVSAGKTQHPKAQLFKRCNYFRTKTLGVVCGHQRNRTDVERSGTGTDNLKFRIVAIALCCEVQRELAIGRAENWHSDGLAIACAAPPDQRDLYSGSRVSREHNAPGVAFVLAHRDAALHETMRLALF